MFQVLKFETIQSVPLEQMTQNCLNCYYAAMLAMLRLQSGLSRYYLKKFYLSALTDKKTKLKLLFRLAISISPEILSTINITLINVYVTLKP